MELIPPNTIHIINLNHYLENSPFAQYLLEHNKQMEPNMNFKIWTENDELVKNYSKFYCGFDFGCFSAYIAMIAIYLYGGTYCELDFEYLHKDFYYNLYNNEPDIIHNIYNEPICRLWDYCMYFFKRKNKIAKLSAELLSRFSRSFFGDDRKSVQDELALQLISKEELIEMKKKVSVEYISNRNHYKALRKNIKFCKLETFEKLNTNKCFYDSINKFYILVTEERPKENIFAYSCELIFNKERLREIYNLLSKFPQFEIEVLDDCLD